MATRLSPFAKAGWVLVLLVLVGMAAWLSARPLVEALASRAVGHPVSIAGSLHLYLFPQPGLSASGVTVAAPDWSARDDMLRIKRMSVSVDPGALLRGQVVLDELRFVAPVLFVERTAQGRLNWASAPGAERESGSGTPDPPLVRRLALDDGQVIYYGHGQGRYQAGIRHALWRKAAGGPGTLEARGRIGGDPWNMRLRLEPAGRGGEGPPYALALDAGTAGLQASARGRLGWPLAPTDLRLRIEGSSLPWRRAASPSPGAVTRPLASSLVAPSLASSENGAGPVRLSRAIGSPVASTRSVAPRTRPRAARCMTPSPAALRSATRWSVPGAAR